VCDDETKELLSEILYSLQSEKYEYGGIFTIGGPTGTYMIKSPWNTECEFSIVGITTSANTGSAFTISSSNPIVTVPTITTSFAAQSLGVDSNNPLDGISGFTTNSSDMFYGRIWQPLGRGAFIYATVNPGVNQACLINIAFRRLFVHLIPETVRTLAPTTHTRPQSRRAIRTIPGVSQQVAGFAAQYPQRDRRGREYYQHENTPWEEDAKSSSTVIHGQRRGR